MKAVGLLGLGLVLQFGDYITGFSTDPPTENGGTAVVAALENATNVSVFCAFLFPGTTTPLTTAWYLTEQGGTRHQILFGLPSAANYFTTGFQTNLTILSFGRNLDMGVLECNNNLDSNNEIAYFMLRIIG